MEMAKPVGRAAASHKYDILSALMAFALSQDKHRQRQVTRMMSLITTRYNWQRDELSMGQEAIAALWSCDVRTVKREIAKLQAIGWLVMKRRGARGRVSVYGIDFSRMMDDTRPAWPNIGQDFVERMDPTRTEPRATNVVALRQVAAPVSNGSLWAEVQAFLHGADRATYSAWFHGMTEVERHEGWLILSAPTKFHATYVETHLMARLMRAIRTIDPTIAGVRIEG
ncbi:hypothetical protein BD830_10711 [Maritimibacter alkaliphilus HTCC2654]|nr:DnaA N-terminal domain-containing protein [Maritimibacter alkaliphilus]TYP80461.1 hypothetical protein BD830_10711 [Maritimibacter alkaliphilus HTCC2654]